MEQRTPAYWPTRIRLAIGIVSTLVVLATALFVLVNQPGFGPQPRIFGLNANVLAVAAGVGLALFGLAWMLRIFFRGRRGDRPAAWRYRDR
jgi:hypothetical protein